MPSTLLVCPEAIPIPVGRCRPRHGFLEADGMGKAGGSLKVFLAAATSKRRSAISSLYLDHGATVLRRARQIMGSDEEAEDILQEIFRKLVEKPESLDGMRNKTAWLYGATTNLCLNRIRNRKNRARLIDERVAPAIPASVEGEAEVRAVLRQALSYWHTVPKAPK